MFDASARTFSFFVAAIAMILAEARYVITETSESLIFAVIILVLGVFIFFEVVIKVYFLLLVILPDALSFRSTDDVTAVVWFMW